MCIYKTYKYINIKQEDFQLPELNLNNKVPNIYNAVPSTSNLLSPMTPVPLSSAQFRNEKELADLTPTGVYSNR